MDTLKQVQNLEKLKEKILSGRTCQFKYKGKGRNCFCAVGHILDFTDHNFDIIGSWNTNSTHIRSIQDLIDQAKVKNDLGFSLDDLEKLQVINDTIDDENERVGKIIETIDEKIYILKNQGEWIYIG